MIGVRVRPNANMLLVGLNHETHHYRDDIKTSCSWMVPEKREKHKEVIRNVLGVRIELTTSGFPTRVVILAYETCALTN